MYGVRLHSSWVNHDMWKCDRHIPTSKTYLSFVERCPSCKQERPSMQYRPEAPPETPPPPDVPHPLLVAKAVFQDYAKDPEWVQGTAIIELPPATITKESMENMRTLRKVTAELDGHAQRGFDGEVVGDLTLRTSDLVRAIQDDGVVRIQDEVGRELLAELKKPDPSNSPNKCPGRGCGNPARDNSPYCSKICSDRCLRLRKKALKAPLLGKELKDLNRILSALESWGKK